MIAQLVALQTNVEEIKKLSEQIHAYVDQLAKALDLGGELVHSIDAKRREGENLSSAIQLFVLDYYSQEAQV